MWSMTPTHGFQPYDAATAPQTSLCLQGATHIDQQKRTTLHEHIHIAAQALNLAQAASQAQRQAPTSTASKAFLGLGRLLFSQLIPEQIQQQLRALQPGSMLQIATNDANLPWEWLHDGHDFLALRHAVARLPMLSKPQAQHKVTPHDAKVAALLLGNPTGDLPGTTQEIKAIIDILYAARERVSYRALFGEHISVIHLQELLAQQSYALIHFAGHARPGALRLSHEDFGVDDILKSLHNHPVVVLNACATGQAETATSDLAAMTNQTQSLASAFIQAGATAVIGMLWPIPDHTAKLWAETLYRHLVGGESIGDALHSSRLRLHQQEPNGIAWLAPVLYGNAEQQIIPAPLKQSSATLLALRFTGPLVSPQKSMPPTPNSQAHRLAELCRLVADQRGLLLHANEGGLLAAFGLYKTSASDAKDAVNVARHAIELLAAWQAPLPAAAILSGDLVATQQVNRGERTANSTSTLPLLLGGPVRESQHYVENASPGQILLNQLARNRCQNPAQYRPWSGTSASGQTITAYEFVSTPVELPVDTLLLDLSVFVGRERENQRLDEGWQAARQGHGQVIGISGEAGIGKSHLVQAFRKRLPSDVVSWVQVVCTVQMQNTPYGLLTRLFRTLLHLPNFVEEIALDTVLRTHFPQLQASDTALLVDLLGSQQQTLHLQEQMVYQHQLYKMLAQLLVDEIGHAPMVFVLEDTHLSDAASMDVLTLLVNDLEEQALLLLLLYRPDWEPPWRRKEHFQSLPLRQFDSLARRKLVEVLLGTAQLPEDLLHLVERASGNPLFLTQILATLVEKGLLTTHESKSSPWRFTGLLDPSELPDSVQRIIDMRLDQLDNEVRDLLALAAVLGSNITPNLLLQGLSCDEAVLFKHLKTLTDHDFLRRTLGSNLYEFRHDLFRDVVYLRIPVPQRQLWHRQVADGLAQRDIHRREAVALLAHHYYHSLIEDNSPEQPLLNHTSDETVVGKALFYLLQSGQDALEKYGGHEAVTLFRRARSVQALLPADVERLARIDTGLGHAYSQINQFDQAAHWYAEAHATHHRQPLTVESRPQAAHLARLLARLYMRWAKYEMAEAWIETGLERVRNRTEGPCQSAVALLHIHAGSVHYDRGDYAQAIEASQTGLRLAEQIADEDAQAEGQFILGAVLQSSGRSDEALAAYQRALEIRKTQQNLFQIHRVEMNIGVAYFGKSEWTTAREYYERAIQFFRRIGELDLLALTSLNLGVAELYLGNFSLAEQNFQSALRIWKRDEMKNQRWLTLCHSNLATLLIEQERWREAKEHLETCMELVNAHQIRDYLPDVLTGLAQVDLGEEQFAEALDKVQRAKRSAAEQGLHLYQALALRVEGCANARGLQAKEAETCLRDSLSILNDLGDRYEAARSKVQLALLLAANDRGAEAASFCRAALEVFEQLGAVADQIRAQALYDQISTG
jgi:tetratricopeptide (TPR) repeat protein/CHAT domain-containing protein